MRKKKALPVFLGPYEIAGYYRGLAQGLRALGVDARFIEYAPYAYGLPSAATEVPVLVRMCRFLERLKGASSGLLLRMLFTPLLEVLRFVFFVTALLRYDAFIFGFGCSFLRGNWDLPILRLLGKKVVMNMAHGSELRPPYIDGARISKDGALQPNPEEVKRLTVSQVFRMRRIEKNVRVIVGAPFSSTQFSKRRLINTFALGIPCQQISIPPDKATALPPDEACDAARSRSERRVRILHSPSHPAAKGTYAIRQTIQNLRAKGHQIEFCEIQDRPNAEVVAAIQKCDFVVDQVYSDTPMAGFAAEAAWFSKPAVVGGYGFKYLKRFVPNGMWPPSQTCHPDDLEIAIETLIINAELREQLGRQAHEFVSTQWPATEVAKRYLRLLEDDIPEEWWLDPAHVVYLHGGGLSEEKAKQNIQDLVKACGKESLQLSHRPDLEKAFLEFANLSRD